MRILYIPLDERPCNAVFPALMAALRTDTELCTLPKTLMGKKKIPGNVEGIWQFAEREYGACDGAVLSAEMLFYGGLLPSRLHHRTEDWREECAGRLRSMAKAHPQVKLYLFQLIMRTPGYNSGDEEPDYYEIYGQRIFKRAWLMDKGERTGLTEAEKEELDRFEKEIPGEYIEDYEWRRAYNLELNRMVLQLVKEGIVELLCIPQDDSCEYGYTARDQKKVVSMIRKERLQRKVLLYPGADEAGCTLVARAISDIQGYDIGIYPYYASAMGPGITPLYEDRAMGESLKSHVMACGCHLVPSAEEADYILAINCPGKVMEESFEQENCDVTYSTFRNLNWFVNTLARWIGEGKKVIMADCAFANGGDLELLELLDEYEVLDQLVSYKAWNTHCNTLGTSIAQGVMAFGQNGRDERRTCNLIYHILDDCLYQAVVRGVVTKDLGDKGLSYFDLKEKQAEVAKEEARLLTEEWERRIQKTFRQTGAVSLNVDHPWNRMFEIGLELEYLEKHLT